MIFVGQSNLLITLDTKKNLSTATGAEILVKNPDGVNSVWSPATISGTTINFALNGSELTKCGEWRLQAKVTFPGGPSYGNIVAMKVDLPLT